MNAQRSVWSPPPPTVQQKYATYLGGHFEDTRYTDRRPRIHLWWTDAEMKLLEYRVLDIPDGLADLIRNLYDREARGLPPRLTSVTHDNMILFFDTFFIGADIITPFAFYVVCDPNSVLRYGIVRLPDYFREFPVRNYFIKYLDSWTWDGRYVWFFLEKERDVFICRLDTVDGTVGNMTLIFDGYVIRSGELVEGYTCDDAGWVATDPRASRAIFAGIVSWTHDLENYVFSSSATAKYLPDGPVVLTDHGVDFVIMLGTFPVGPVAMFHFRKGLSRDGSVHIVVGERVAVTIPVIMSGYPYYFATTSTGLPYDLVMTTYSLNTNNQLWLLRYDGRIATIVFCNTQFLDRYSTGGRIDVLIEYDVNTGRAVKDIVVPRRPGDTLALPMMTSSKGRLNLP